MKSVVLSSAEAECIGVSEVVRELQFVIQLLQTINIEVQFPIKVKMDNVGTIWLANNTSSGERIRHIDIQAHFIKGFVWEGVIDIGFVTVKMRTKLSLTVELMPTSKMVWQRRRSGTSKRRHKLVCSMPYTSGQG